MRNNAYRTLPQDADLIATVSAFHSLRHSFHLSLAVLIFGLFSACLKSPSAPPVQEPTTITLSTYRIVFTAINESIRIDATVLDQDSRVITDATVHWRSADNSVARVSDRGVVTAAGSGTTQISVSSGYATATATVSVEQEASSIEISPSAITISQVGGTGRFTAVVYDANNRPILVAAVVWSSSNPEIATVDANGRLTAVSRGSALITASSGGVSTSRPVFVEVPRVPSRVVLNVTEATLATVGQSLQLDAQVYDSAGAAIPGAAVAWTSSRPEIATVDASGLVIAVANGTTRITASSRGVSAQAIIHVVIEDTEPPEPPPVPPEPPPPPPEPPGTSADREALIAFYHATDGPNWMDNTKWLSENPLNEWYGVSTDADGRVTKLSLRENQLTGSIPPEIEQLQNLILLNLSRNRITGTIPPVFGKMNALRYLHLGDNQLTGEIPPETYQSNTLMILSLFDNQLSGEIPPAIGKLANLIDLHLSTNQFTGHIPPEIGQLSNLAYLALNGNQLTGVIPHEIGQLLNLGSLSLEGNRLTGVIPHEIGQLEKLNGLLLNDNLLTGEIPSEIGQLVNLNGLVLHGNRLTGEIPSEIGQLVGLKSLILSDNQLSGGLPPEIGQLNKMDRLILNDNRDLSGPLPIELVNVPLVQLRLQNTQLCAPLNAGFQMWLAGIEDKSVENCATMPGPDTDPEPPPSSDTSSDRDALIAFYHATDGPNWTDNTNWLSDEPIGT
ncbi:MAG: hypothetical protein F4132_08345 [Gemmatimonadetes bacterium]|nr:hypothetical protein [Gemmatimonadota bacterium]